MVPHDLYIQTQPSRTWALVRDVTEPAALPTPLWLAQPSLAANGFSCLGEGGGGGGEGGERGRVKAPPALHSRGAILSLIDNWPPAMPRLCGPGSKPNSPFRFRNRLPSHSHLPSPPLGPCPQSSPGCPVLCRCGWAQTAETWGESPRATGEGWGRNGCCLHRLHVIQRLQVFPLAAVSGVGATIVPILQTGKLRVSEVVPDGSPSEWQVQTLNRGPRTRLCLE